MASITIRNLDEQTTARLPVRAAHSRTHGPMLWGVVVALALLAVGCGARGMRAASPGQALQPAGNEAVVVFMRPWATQGNSAPLFENRPDADRFIGILRAGTRIAYRSAPGRTRFMVVSTAGTAQFLAAELDGGKTYYVIMSNQQMAGRPSFVLRPVRPGEETADFETCAARCTWVENTETSEAWARSRREQIAERKARDLPAWESAPDRPTLRASDGRQGRP